MSQNILIDGKPLHLLRVVDLRDELKKRGIKTTGTKAHLQELLISVCFCVYKLNVFYIIIVNQFISGSSISW